MSIFPVTKVVVRKLPKYIVLKRYYIPGPDTPFGATVPSMQRFKKLIISSVPSNSVVLEPKATGEIEITGEFDYISLDKDNIDALRITG